MSATTNHFHQNVISLNKPESILVTDKFEIIAKGSFKGRIIKALSTFCRAITKGKFDPTHIKADKAAQAVYKACEGQCEKTHKALADDEFNAALKFLNSIAGKTKNHKMRDEIVKQANNLIKLNDQYSTIPAKKTTLQLETSGKTNLSIENQEPSQIDQSPSSELKGSLTEQEKPPAEDPKKSSINKPKDTSSHEDKTVKEEGSVTEIKPLKQPEVPKEIPVPEPKKISIDEAQKSLESGIKLPQKTLDRIKELMPKISGGKDDPGIKQLGGRTFAVFAIPEEPNFIFKMRRCNVTHDFGSNTQWGIGGREDTEKLFKNKVKAKKVIMENNLDRLTLPKAKLYEIPVKNENYEYTYALIAEKRLPIDEGKYEQEDLYYNNAEHLEVPVKQLAKFIYETGDNEVSFDTYPVLQDGPNLRIGVIGLEELGKDPAQGFWDSDWHSQKSLVKMMPSEKLIDLVITEAQNYKITFMRKGFVGLKEESFEDVKSSQMNAIKRHDAYEKLHKDRNIKTGAEPVITLDEIKNLGLDLEETWEYKGKTYKLKDAVEYVVGWINDSIKEKAKNKSLHVKVKRDVRIPINHEPLITYQNLGLPEKEEIKTWKQESQLWLHRICLALREKGFIYDYGHGGHGYWIQA